MKGGLTVVTILAALALALTTGIFHQITPFYEKALPDAFEATGRVTNWFDFILPIPPGGGGAVVFRLAPGTIEKVHRQGIAFFSNARQRGYSANDPKGQYYFYATWRTTPAPSNWFGDGSVVASLNCAGFGESLIHKIVDGGKRRGGFLRPSLTLSLSFCQAHGSPYLPTSIKFDFGPSPPHRSL